MSSIFCYSPIGIIHTEHQSPKTSPIQSCYAQGCLGKAVLFSEYAEGLKDLDEYSHVYLLYHCHRAVSSPLLVKPFLQNVKHGLFSTRVPDRPNPIGMSIVRLLSVKNDVLNFDGADMLDGTPLLDIKPYSRRIDCILDTQDGWQSEIDDNTAYIIGSRKYIS